MKNKPIAQSLPGIVSVACVECDKLPPNVVRKFQCGIPVGIFTTLTPIASFGEATCESVNEYDCHGRVVTTTLRFLSNDTLPTYHALAFVISDCSGQQFLIGAKEPPLPIIKSSSHTGEPDGERHATTYVITWIAESPPIPCATTQ